jgi:DNA-binding NtrC family response regulator
VNIHVPPLRERADDIALLANHFCAQFAQRFGLPDRRLSERLLADLAARPWPGNVRELENCVERLVALSNETVIDADPSQTTTSSSAPIPLRDRLAAVERGFIIEALSHSHHNYSEAARLLGISRPTLYEKLKRYGLRVE